MSVRLCPKLFWRGNLLLPVNTKSCHCYVSSLKVWLCSSSQLSVRSYPVTSWRFVIVRDVPESQKCHPVILGRVVRQNFLWKCELVPFRWRFPGGCRQSTAFWITKELHPVELWCTVMYRRCDIVQRGKLNMWVWKCCLFPSPWCNTNRESRRSSSNPMISSCIHLKKHQRKIIPFYCHA